MKQILETIEKNYQTARLPVTPAAIHKTLDHRLSGLGGAQQS
jgi:hypothetical protein